jgi:UDP-N-acetylmuramoyl-tripeptide--D-alanyl-D-alanine ligase
MTPQPASSTIPAIWDLDAATAERLTAGRWVGVTRSVRVQGAAVDSRAVTGGMIFACIRGERVDGHDFAAVAAGAGAALILANRALDLPVPVLVVRDVAAALLALAGELRQRLTACTWIGVAGSNGKTTTKGLIAAACAGAGLPVHATRGNLNNHLGVPLTILATPADARWAVIELGANHPGEVATLARACAPQVGCVTSLGPEHLEGFGGFLGVVDSECELLPALPLAAPACVGLHGLADHCADHGTTVEAVVARIRAAAAGRDLTLFDDATRPTGHGLIPVGAETPDGVRLGTSVGAVLVPLLGAHNRANAALAFRVACAAGVPAVDAARGLAAMVPVAGRLVPTPWGRHLILDDTYNANPASMIVGLRTLASLPGAKLAVLGAMGELGADSAAGHRRVGAEAAALGIPLVVVGEAASAMLDGCPGALLVTDTAAAISVVRARLATATHTLLVKASRSQRLERVVAGLTATEAP